MGVYQAPLLKGVATSSTQESICKVYSVFLRSQRDDKSTLRTRLALVKSGS